MQIHSVELRNLVTFRFAQIKALTATYSDTLQLILGTNGSGKSNLLRQLSPMPPTRSDFVENGYKRLTLSHREKSYILTSDFSRKDSVHSFNQDGVEMNEGGSTEVQKELVRQYLGWNNDVEALCFNTFDFCGMSTGQREALFTRLNPLKIGFILDYAKTLKSQSRTCKNLIARLLDRKVLIEAKLLEPALLKELTAEQKDLQDKTTFFNKMLVKLERPLQDLRSIPEPAQGHSAFDETIGYLHETNLTLQRDSYSWAFVDRKDPSGQILSLEKSLATYDFESAQIETRIVEEQQWLRNLTADLRDYVEEDHLIALRAQISSLDAELHGLIAQKCETPFPIDLLRAEDRILPTLHEILSQFMDGPSTLIPRKGIERKRRLHNHWINVRNEYTRLVRSSLSKCEHYEKSLTYKLSDIPDQPCAKSACPLYANFKSSYDTTQKLLADERRNITLWNQRISTINRYLDLQDTQFRTHAPYVALFQRLSDLISEYAPIQMFFRGSDVLNRIASNPLGFYHQIKAHFTSSQAYYAIPPVEEKLLRLRLELAQSEKMTGMEKEALTKQIADLTEKLENDQVRDWELHLLKEQAEGRIAHIKSFLKALETLDENLDYTQDLITSNFRHHERNKLEWLRDTITKSLNEILSRHSEIQLTLKDQSALQERYKHEILSVLEDTEKERDRIERVVSALDDIPYEYTTKYVNTLLRSANAFIAKVFTYPLYIPSVGKEKSFQYKLPYVADTTDSPDISRCSTAQMEMINLALTLACRQALGLNDYPLFLDEVGKTFDPAHQQKLLDLFVLITDEQLASQLFIVNHHAVIHGGLLNAETLVLSDLNIMKTDSSNRHVVMESY